MPKGMFTELMEASDEKPRPERGTSKKGAPQAHSAHDSLSTELEDLSTAGYNSHSYRLSEAEIRWFRRFCLRASERLDRHISHNTLFRVMLRLADDEWRRDPNGNRLLKLLSQIK